MQIEKIDTLWHKEKMLRKSNFRFCHDVFKTNAEKKKKWINNVCDIEYSDFCRLFDFNYVLFRYA